MQDVTPKLTPELDELAREKFRKTSELLGADIYYLLDRKPTHLSGGEQQRVALGRCITRDPSVFLLDEPYSNLDQKLREKYRFNLKALLSHFGITTVYVTHDQEEAQILADFIAIMDVGQILQVGTYEEIYIHPDSIFVAEFLNLDIDTPAINLIDGNQISEEMQGLIVGVRPEDIEICEGSHEISTKGRIKLVKHIILKDMTIFIAQLREEEVYGRISSKENLSVDTDVWLGFKRYHVFDKKTGLRVKRMLGNSRHQPIVQKRRDWYY